MKTLLLFVPLLLMLLMPALAQETAPNFTISDIDGNPFSLSNYTGKVILLDFFGTWCSDCIDQLSHLKSLQSEFGEDLAIVSISVGPSFDTVEKLQKFRRDHDINWIVARDTEGVGDEYKVDVIPKLAIIDQEGYIKHQHVGRIEYTVLQEEIYEITSDSGSNNTSDTNNNTNTNDTSGIVIIMMLALAIIASSVVVYTVFSRLTSRRPK